MSQRDDITSHHNLQDLAHARRWVAYSGAPKGEGEIDKAPLNPKTGGNAQNSNPATWGTRAAAEARAKALKAPGHKPGVGIELGELGDGTALCGVDLDGCHDAAAGLEPWAQEISDRLRTYGEVSPSGRGVKLFFRVKTEDLPAVREAMGTEHRKTWKRGGHYGAELHLSNSYYTVTGWATGGHGDGLRLVPLADLIWLVEEAGPACLKPAGALVAIRDDSGSGHAFRLLLDLFRAGSTEEEAIADIAVDKGPAGDWWGRTDDRQHERAVAGAKAKAEEELGDRLGRFNRLLAESGDAEIDFLCGLPTAADQGGDVALSGLGKRMMRNGKITINMNSAIFHLGRDVENILPGLRHNLMTGRDEWRDGALDDAALVLARVALEQRGLDTIGKDLVADAALAVARLRQYHPIRDGLDALAHDGRPGLDSWLVRHAGAEDTPFVRAAGRKFLIQMVARVMEPGCKADHTLVLSGPQGQNKSAACRILAGAEYFSDTLPSITGDKTDAIRHLQGKWLVELAELAPSRKSEAEDLKAFLSGAVDRVRLPYARFDQSFPRQGVFVGTTNEDQFLRDATGGRRFWPVTVGRVIDIEALAAERDQLFAEAVTAYRAGEAWWMDRDFEAEHARPAQAAAYVSDSWGDTIAAWLDKPEEDFDGPRDLRTEVNVADVLTGALGMTGGQQTMAAQKRTVDVLKGLGWTKAKSHGRMIWRRGTA